MAHALTEVSTHTASITVPDDGDDLEAASVEVGMQGLANRTHRHNRILGGLESAPGSLTVTTDVSVGNNISAGGEVSADELVSLGNLVVSSSAQIGLDLEVLGAADVTGDLSVGDDLDVTGDATIGGTTVFQLATGVNVNVTGYLKGRHILSIFPAVDSNQTIFPATYEYVYAHSLLLTASRDYTINDAGCIDGHTLTVHNAHGTFAIVVKAPGGATLGSSSNGNKVYVARVAGAWQII